MAMVSGGFRVKYNWIDNGGGVTSRTYEFVPAIATIGAAETAAASAIAALEAVTDAVLQSYQVTEVFIEDTLALPASGVENENQAFFSAKIDGDPLESATFSVPAADPDIFTALSGPGATVVDMSDAAVIAFVALFDSAGPFTLSDGENINVATATGKRRHVKNSNG